MSSIQPRKQRLALYSAPHHVARKQIASHLSEELLLKYNRRSLTLIVGDEVKVMRGDHAGKSGKVVTVDVPARKVAVEGVTHKKADGTEIAYPLHASNLVIVRLNLEDARRRDRLGETEEASKMGKAGTPKERPAKAKAAAKPATKAEPKTEAKPKPAAKKEEKPVEASA
ncbi:MAG TPA: 50S ribosomal protein L24 [Candidatus Thermoplasmatota archaeon]|nr:50S ribosomal protein L24 [Candidatus Thermoplasmatota archaeon]